MIKIIKIKKKIRYKTRQQFVYFIQEQIPQNIKNLLLINTNGKINIVILVTCNRIHAKTKWKKEHPKILFIHFYKDYVTKFSLIYIKSSLLKVWFLFCNLGNNKDVRMQEQWQTTESFNHNTFEDSLTSVSQTKKPGRNVIVNIYTYDWFLALWLATIQNKHVT